MSSRGKESSGAVDRRAIAAAIGNRLRVLREKRSIEAGRVVSQAAVGAATGLDAPRVNLYERGKKVPSTPVLSALARYYGVTLEYLISGECEPRSLPKIGDFSALRERRRLEPLIAKLETLTPRRLRLVKEILDDLALLSRDEPARRKARKRSRPQRG